MCVNTYPSIFSDTSFGTECDIDTFNILIYYFHIKIVFITYFRFGVNNTDQLHFLFELYLKSTQIQNNRVINEINNEI